MYSVWSNLCRHKLNIRQRHYWSIFNLIILWYIEFYFIDQIIGRHGENGSETITWNEGSADVYKYLLYVHDYSQLGFSESEGRISFYGEEVVKMEVEDGNNEDRWFWNSFDKITIRTFATIVCRYWMLGSFEPSEGVSLFSIDGEFQTDNPGLNWTLKLRCKKNQYWLPLTNI